MRYLRPEAEEPTTVVRKPPQEFRRYRQALRGLFALVAVGGVLYLVVSIAVNVFFRPETLAKQPQITGNPASATEKVACHREVQALFDDLNSALSERQKDVGRTHEDVLTKWDTWKASWHQRWAQTGYRCRFQELRGGAMGEQFSRLAELHEELEVIEQRFDALLLRFLRNEAQEVASMRSALQQNLAAMTAAQAMNR